MFSNLIPSLKYLWLTIKHKWFVAQAGFELNVSLYRLIKHDWSKFTPWELPYYGKQFFGDKSDSYGFIKAWIHHQSVNDHHWEYWIPRSGHSRCTPPYPDDMPVEMSEQAAREMVADWMGASRAYEGKWPVKEKWNWLNNNLDEVLSRTHPNTRMLINSLVFKYKKI